jgi:hypothetical protein
MSKKGGEFEINAIDFLEKIFKELGYEITRKRIQNSGSQDGYDDLIEIVDNKFRSYTIYSECKDYSSKPSYLQAIEKIPHIISTHKNIDLLLFISPYQDFSNTNENSKVEGFYQVINDVCPVEFLVPESFVEEYFTLYPDLYKKVYRKSIVALPAEERVELLKRFEKLIFSSRNLKRIVIEEEDRTQFILKNTNDEFHIGRNFRRFQQRNRYILENPDYYINLEDYLNSSEFGVVVLGNPGYGKSEELRNFSVTLWESREVNQKIPKFQSLKNFSTDTIIENLLPKDYKHIFDLVVIFDGLDEVHNIVDFTNKLRNFISDNEALIKKNRIKFVISCRTSIYNKCIKDLGNLEVCFLNEVTEGAAARFLLNKYNLDLRAVSGFNFFKYRDILENPFYLKLLGNHYKNSGKVLLNKSRLIEKYVEYRLDEDEIQKFRNDISFDKSEILETSKKIALAMESMQKTSISQSEITYLCGKRLDLFKNPFLEESIEKDIWSFEHKNIQEYFVAKVLAGLEFDEIIYLLRIDEKINKIHPTWINVIFFLLNLDLKDHTYNQLVNWISKYDFQFIFAADPIRISDDIKIKCLQQLFEENCVKNTLWIDDSFEIGIFGNVEENVNYLINNAKDKNLHTRARISAVNLLSQMSYSSKQSSEIKQLILMVFDEFEIDMDDNLYFLQESIGLIKNAGLKNDLVFYQEIFDKVKPYDYKEIVDALINSIPEELLESNLDYFLDILKKSIRENQWNYISKTRNIISRKESIFATFKKINNVQPLLKIYSFLIDRHKNDDIRESLIKDFLLHLQNVFSGDIKIKNDLVNIISDAVVGDKIRYYEDDLLIDLVKSCSISKEVFDKIFCLFSGNYSQKSFLAEIIEEDSFPQIVQKYNESNLNDDFINGFRNIMVNRDVDLTILFEKAIEGNTKFRFDEKIDKEEIAARYQLYSTNQQREFDVLFDNYQLQKQINEIFRFKKKKQLSFKDMANFFSTYHNNEDLRKIVTNNARELLGKILGKIIGANGSLNLVDLPAYIEACDLTIMISIKNVLPKDNEHITISSQQVEFIKNWCMANTERVNNAYEKYMSNGTLWNDEDSLIFKTIYHFQRYFKFDLSEEIILNMIWVQSFKNNLSLDFIPENFPKDKVDKRIIDNANSTTEISSLYSYIYYLKENQIDLGVIEIDIKQLTRDSLLSSDDYYPTKFIELLYSDDINFLQELTDFKYLKPKRYFIDSILNLLAKQGKYEFVATYLSKNYDNLINTNVMEEANIIKNLIMTNNALGFKKLLKLVMQNPEQYVNIDNHFHNATWQRYSNINSIDDLISILNISMLNYDKEKINRSHYSPIRISTEAIVNICNNQDSKICESVLIKLNELDLNKIIASGGDLFYINKIKKDVQEIFLNHKSTPYSPKKAQKFIRDNEHIFFI